MIDLPDDKSSLLWTMVLRSVIFSEKDYKGARSETSGYIEGYYNRVRRHSAIGYKSPEEFEREINLKKKGSCSESLVSSKT